MRVGVGTSTKFEDFAGIEQTLSSFVATETRAGALNLRPSYALPRNCPLPHPSSFLRFFLSSFVRIFFFEFLVIMDASFVLFRFSFSFSFLRNEREILLTLERREFV